MNEVKEDIVSLEEPKYTNEVSNQQLLMGKFVSPIDKLKIINDTEFEELIEEWLYGYIAPKYGGIEKIVRIGGAGDKGRDVIAYKTFDTGNPEETKWDNYQCKYYNAPLTPSEVMVEFGKLCYYTYHKHYTIPEKYYLVSPHGVGGKLHDFIMNPNHLREELINQWDSKCKKKITSQEVEITGDFKGYVESFDFSIIDFINPSELINQYEQTIYFPFRFGGGLRELPKRPDRAPEDIEEKELLYTQKLFEAYSDHKGEDIKTLDDLNRYNFLKKHFNRQRTYFHQAEAIKVFERQTLPDGVKAFYDLKEEIYHGIIDSIYSDYEDGYERLIETSKEARKLVIGGMNILSSVVNGNDKCGICHHLANENSFEEEITWVIDDE